MLKIKQVSKTFYTNDNQGHTVFNHLDFNVNNGEFITIIGSNGAGKSTLFNLISQNLKADEGQILLNNQDITKLKEYQVAKRIARIYQNPNLNVAMNMTVFENISLAMNKGKSFNLKLALNKHQKQQLKDQLTQLNIGLENHLDTKAKFLSGGQRQALCLYMASLSQPDLLLLDEHTAALDPQSSDVVLKLTEDIVNENKLTTIMITHNMKQAITYGDRLIMLHQGKVIIDVSGEEKKQLTIDKLLTLFNDIKGELSDELLFN